MWWRWPPGPGWAPEAVPAAAPLGSREAFDPATSTIAAAPLYDRKALRPGMGFPGPALVVEDETTTVVPPGFTAWVNALGQIILEDLA